MKKIYHYTRKEFLGEIERDGKLLTEKQWWDKHLDIARQYGCNPEFAKMIFREYGGMQDVFKLVGSFVWFSENPNGCGTATGVDVSFQCYAEQIGAIRWCDYKKRFKKFSDAKNHCVELDEITRRTGDNPNKYWVVPRSVSLKHCKKNENVKSDFVAITEIGELQSVA